MSRINWRAAILSGTALALAISAPAAAQDAPGAADDFRLQPATPTAPPTPAPAPPVIAPPPPVIAPSARPTPTASPAPRTPAARPTPAASPSPRPAATATASATPGTSASPSPAPAPLPPLASPVPEALPSLASEPALPAAQPAGGEPIWPWLAGGAAVLALGAAAVLRRRRKAEPEADYYEEDAPLAAPPPEPAGEAQPAPPPKPTPLPEPALSLGDVPPPPAPPLPVPRGKAAETLAVTLSAKRLSATLMNTALTYELTVTNTGAEPIGPIAVSGDMIGAHSSIPPKILLETAADGEPQHRVPLLGPGESAAMSGELRLPLAAITPIRHGTATLFVPLARFRLLVFRDGRPPVSANHAFVVGEEPATPGAALKPFRLDLGPRLYSGITQRELALPA